jgi:solute:Na+ symporter, SSS family
LDRAFGQFDGGICMNNWDFLVLIGSLAGIAIFGVWRTRGRRSLSTYLKGNQTTGWVVVGISVMATQASATTFISATGQGYQSGLYFVQNYFGLPLAMIIIAAFFLPRYRGLNVYTAYEYLGRRFDGKTRLLGAGIFLMQRGLNAGLTIYAPAIVLSTLLGWSLDLTIIISGLVATTYTVAGGSEAVTITQKYQMAVIFGGMVTAFIILVTKLPAWLSFGDALTVAGGFGKLQSVDYSFDPAKRYTLWTGLLGGLFLALAYFGTDQSQVQRYISGANLRESRLGLMFNAVLKIPMQFFILLLGALVFVFYQFVTPPLFFNEPAWKAELQGSTGSRLSALENQFTTIHAEKQKRIQEWLNARHAGDSAAADTAQKLALAAHEQSEIVRADAKTTIKAANPRVQENDTDYVFMTFVLRELPHGIIGLLVAAIFAAALQSKAAELNALASASIVDFYRFLVVRHASDQHYVKASRCFTALWGLISILFALGLNLTENLIQAANIVGSVFYPVVLGMFLVAFFLRWVGGTAVFLAALAAQTLVIFLYLLELNVAYLWYNVIGSFACVVLSLLIQTAIWITARPEEGASPS